MTATTQTGKPKRSNGEGTRARHVPERNHWRRNVTVKDATGASKRITVYGKTERECNANAVAAQNASNQGAITPAKQIGVRDLVRLYLEHCRRQMEAGQLRRRTYEAYESKARLHLLPAFDAVKVNNLRPTQVQAFLAGKQQETNRRGKPYSGNEIRQIRDVLRQAYSWGITNGLAQKNPVKEFRLRQTQPKPQKAILTQLLARQFLRHVEGDRLEALWWLGVNLGPRIGEALGLTWDAVDLDNRVLVIRAQTQRVRDPETGRTMLVTGQPPKPLTSNRVIRLSPTLARKLSEHKTRQDADRLEAGDRWREHGLVFTTRYGTPLDSPNVTKYLRHHLEAVGLPLVTFHGLRHTANSQLAAEGVTLKARQAILGHSDPRLTEALYTHAMPAELDAVADVLDRLYGGD